MAELRKPTEIEPKKTTSILIYGQPSIGKTTLACSAPKAVLFDYDNGVNRIHPAHVVPTLQVESWEDTSRALETIAKDGYYAGTKTIVVDTVGKLLEYMGETIMRNNPKMKKADGTLSLQGFGLRKKMFTDFVHALETKGYNVVFVAHEKEDKKGEEIIKRPLIGGSSGADLIQELDLVGYMETRDRKRTINFALSDDYYTKDSCYIGDLEIPVVVSADGMDAKTNTFMEEAIFGAFRKAQQRKIDLTRQYNELIEEVDKIVAGVADLEELNAAMEILKAKPVLYDSKIKAGLKLNTKAREMNAKWDAESKQYVAA